MQKLVPLARTKNKEITLFKNGLNQEMLLAHQNTNNLKNSLSKKT